MREQIINYLRERRIEPTNKDINFFETLLKWELEDKNEEISKLKSMVDNAHCALEAVLDSGICLIEHEAIINKGLSNLKQG